MPTLNLRIAIPALAVLFVLLAAASARHKSLTWDEPTFITTGYTYLDKSDFRLNPEAPPLLQELVALPIVHGEFVPPDYAHEGWEKRAQVAFARDHTIRNADRIEAFAWWARFPTWILGACLIIGGAAWCAQMAGPTSALVFGLLAAVSPNLLAHGRLATTDFGCAVLMLAAVCTFWRAIHDNRILNWVIVGLVTGLALLSKFTALLLGPTFVILGLVELRAGNVSAASLIKGGGITAAAILGLLFVGYDFQAGPALYLAGLDAIYSRFTAGYQFYLMGDVLDKPVWYYHVVAFLLKTPEPTILLLCIALYATVRSPRLRRPAIYLLTPVALLFLASSFDKANLGLRRVLPAYPFLFAFIAVAASTKPCRACKMIYAGLVAWAVLASALAYPHYLSYVNTFSGGISNGPYLLDDSNIDWGQDLPALAFWQRQNPGETVELRYFGTMEPSLYDVRASRMPDEDVLLPRPGRVYAISAHNLVHFRKVAHRIDRPDIDWLALYTPFERLGGSIYLYRFPQKKLPVND